MENASVGFDSTITEELVTNLVKAMWTKSYFVRQHWVPYFEKFREFMQKNPTEYIKHIAFACHMVSDHTQNIFERFLDVYTTVITLTVMFKLEVHNVFVPYTPRIFTVYFDLELEKPFYQDGGWKRLHKVISRKEYIKGFKDVVGIQNTINAFADVEKFKKIVRGVTLLNKPLSYKPETVSKFDIDTHQPTVRLTSWITQTFINEQFSEDEGDGPMEVAELRNSLSSVINVLFNYIKVLHLTTPSFISENKEKFYDDTDPLLFVRKLACNIVYRKSADSIMRNKCLRKLKNKPLVLFALSNYVKSIGEGVNELAAIFQCFEDVLSEDSM
ncbi:hypothetical protein CDAR_41861 [Caerostris darwini]|uniref:Uncharacterized protein n=1 Tax=Caerostris darwini TaxID=1538125 RepID=A0AAV4V3G7_9ARAC|nr:hypothetical protein CDAR_41861 [Caerostris darwini]